jgi:hypothetical protein
VVAECKPHSDQYTSSSPVPVAVLMVVSRMSPSLCNPKLGDDYPPGFKIWIHEIYPDIHVTTTKMQMDHFLESSPVFHDDMVARLNQNRQRQQELELESQEEGQNTRASREQIEALIREESMLIRRERLAAENSNSSNTRPCANPGSLKWFHIPANHMRWVDVSQISKKASARAMQLIPSNSSHFLQHTMEEPIALMRSCGRTCFALNYRETVDHQSMQHTCYLLFSQPGPWRTQISTPCLHSMYVQFVSNRVDGVKTEIWRIASIYELGNLQRLLLSI